jgi:Na+/H+ antiporter NhaD/arsenite permease-like protein
LIEDRDELIRTVPILVATILVFFLHRALGLEPATVALAGATAMMLVTRQPLDEALAGIEWRKLFFFLGRGLFVMVGALEETGAIRELADGIATLTDGDRTAELRGIAWASALGSGLSTTSPSPPRWSPPWSSCRNATPATTPTGGRSRSAPASAATPG